MSIHAGRFNIPLFLLAMGISLLITLVLLAVKKYDKRYRDIIFNLFFISFVSWKLSPLFSNFKGFLDNPIATLYLPGGTLGYFFAGIASLVFVLYKIKKEKIKLLPIMTFFLLTISLAITLPLFIKSETQEIKLKEYYFEDINESVITIAQDDIVILNFWATWCPPCKAELPELNSFYLNNSGLTFYGVNLLETETSKDDVLNFIDKADIVFPVLFEGENSLSDYFEIKTIPTTIVLLKEDNGYKVNKHSGAITKELLENIIKR